MVVLEEEIGSRLDVVVVVMARAKANKSIQVMESQVIGRELEDKGSFSKGLMIRGSLTNFFSIDFFWDKSRLDSKGHVKFFWDRNKSRLDDLYWGRNKSRLDDLLWGYWWLNLLEDEVDQNLKFIENLIPIDENEVRLSSLFRLHSPCTVTDLAVEPRSEFQEGGLFRKLYVFPG